MIKKFIINSPIKIAASAAVANPALGWMEFILTDNQPNENKQGIKQEAFAALVTTGILMPLKMAEGEIAPGHELAFPLGVISTLEIMGNTIEGQAALWKSERPTDYGIIKNMFEEGEALNISWEIAYTQASLDEEGIEWLDDPILLSATLVGIPAYSGRTTVTTVASTEEDETVDYEKLYGELKISYDAIKASLEGLSATGEDDITKVIASLIAKNDELKAYKETKEKEETDATILSERLKQLSEAGVSFTDDEITARKNLWLSLDNDTFTVLVSDLTKRSEASVNDDSIPDLSGEPNDDDLDIVRKGLESLGKRR